MAKKPPKLFPINHDDYHAKHIGTTADGRQFFLTTPFVPATKDSRLKPRSTASALGQPLTKMRPARNTKNDLLNSET